MTRTEIITVIDPKPEPHPDRYAHTDTDGDRLLATTAYVPGHGPGVYFRTDPNGSVILTADLPAFIAQLQIIAEAAKADTEDAPAGPADATPVCGRCAGTRHVCENHPDRPWGGLCCAVGAEGGTTCEHGACGCGAGTPCPACAAPAVVESDHA